MLSDRDVIGDYTVNIYQFYDKNQLFYCTVE